MSVDVARPALDVGIVTSDIERMLAFYRDVLGLPAAPPTTVPGVGRIHRLSVGSSILRLLDPDQPAERGGGGPSVYSYSGIRFVSLAVRNLDEVLERCREAGAVPPQPPRRFAGGLVVAALRDPDGNWIEFQQAG